jgi:L-aspartate oxidase
MHTDYLIIGSGIAGLTFAIKISAFFPDKTITIVTKSTAEETNTKYAQGGIAVVQNQTGDHFKKHIEDTLICGDGLCNQEVVEMVVTQGPKRLQELIDWGANFDMNSEGLLDLGREGGHSKNRVVHHKDQTGFEIERAILAQANSRNNIQILDFHFALELISEKNQCFGAYVLNEITNEILTLQSDITLLATGGIGQVYGYTTNPAVATGDGIAMAKRAGATIKDMEFIQFHPTALYDKTTTSTFLISEAVRGFGAYLRTKKGHRFMLDYDERADLASRDIVSKSIETELKKSGEACVYLDCTHLNPNDFIKHFPMIYRRCKDLGIAIEKDWIPVLPAQHYVCGGIAVDRNGKTTIENLFACGESSRTGLHGANRLASNSLLEALVYADNIYNFLIKQISKNSMHRKEFKTFKPIEECQIDPQYILNTKNALQHLMQNNVGIVRHEKDLLDAKNKLKNWKNEVTAMQENHQITKGFYELKNMIAVGILIVDQSIARQENRGGFVKI